MSVKRCPEPSDEQGLALVLVLWGIAILGILAAGFAVGSGSEARRMANVIAAAEARALLDSGLSMAVVCLADPQPASRWRADGTAYQRYADGAPFPGDGGQAGVRDGEAARLRIRIFADSGRLDVNTTSVLLISNLIKGAADDTIDADSMTAAIVKWRAPVTDLSTPRPGRPFLSVVELAGLPGMTTAFYGRIADSLTVHNQRGKPDWRTAGRRVLHALPGLAPADSDAILRNRRQSLFLPAADLAKRLDAAGASTEPVTTPFNGQIFTIRIEAVIPHRAGASAEAVVRLLPTGPLPYRTLEWREPAPAELEDP